MLPMSSFVHSVSEEERLETARLVAEMVIAELKKEAEGRPERSAAQCS